jgi:ERF superfamily
MSEIAALTPNEAITTLQVAPSGGLVAAIAAVMRDVHTVAKNGQNTFHNYRYARMEDILKEVTPLLGKHGLVIFQSETGRAMFDEDNVIAVEYAFTVAHVSGEKWEALRQTGVSCCRASNGRWDDKSLNKCHTAARKYFLLALFQIPTGEEADADQGENDQKNLSEYSGQKLNASRSDGHRGIADRAIEARRAAVQLRNALPQPAYVIEPPKRRLQRELDRQRHTGNQYEAQIKSEQRREGRFRQPLQERVDNRKFQQPPKPQTQYTEINPPPTDDIPDGPGKRTAAIDHSDRGGIPSFLDRRRSNGSADDAPASYLDLVGGG